MAKQAGNKVKQATSYTEEVAAGSSTSRRVGVAFAVVSGAVLVAAVVLRATELQRENADLRRENVELSKEQSAMDIRLAIYTLPTHDTRLKHNKQPNEHPQQIPNIAN